MYRGAFLTLALCAAGCAEHAARPPRHGAHLAGAAGYGLPPGARLIEIAQLAAPLHPDRALLLWMIDPEVTPYWGEPDEPYTCPDETSGSHYRGPTPILALADVNGDGRPHEAVLYDRLNCAVLWTTLIGYSATRDQVIQYPVTLTIERGPERRTETRAWGVSLFAEPPVSPGRWRYELDFTGRGGCVDRYEIAYDTETEAFSGREVLTECPDE